MYVCTLEDKVYDNPHNEDYMKGRIKKVLASISAKEMQYANNVFVRYTHGT
jgi:hypothetical protein